MLNKVNFLFVSLFGIGKIKKIPGSFASLATILFLFLGNAAGLLNIFRLTSNQNYTVGFLQKKRRPENGDK